MLLASAQRQEDGPDVQACKEASAGETTPSQKSKLNESRRMKMARRVFSGRILTGLGNSELEAVDAPPGTRRRGSDCKEGGTEPRRAGSGGRRHTPAILGSGRTVLCSCACAHPAARRPGSRICWGDLNAAPRLHRDVRGRAGRTAQHRKQHQRGPVWGAQAAALDRPCTDGAPLRRDREERLSPQRVRLAGRRLSERSGFFTARDSVGALLPATQSRGHRGRRQRGSGAREGRE